MDGLTYKERLYQELVESNSDNKTIFGTLVSEWNTKSQDMGNAVFIKEDTYLMYVPDNCPENARLVTYYPGADGYGNDATALRNYINQTHPNDIVLIVKNCSRTNETAEMNHYYLNIVNEVAKEKNINISNCDFYGFSAGNRSAYQGTLQAIRENPNLGPQTSVIIDGAYNNSSFTFSNEEVNLLKSNGARFLFFEGTYDNGGITSNNVLNLAKQGIPVVVAQIDGVDHSGVNRFVFDNKVMDYVNGKASSFSNSNKVRYYTYDVNSGNFVSINDSKALSILRSGVSSSGVSGNIDYSDLVGRYAYLKSLSLVPSDVLNNPNLTSDESFIVSHSKKITGLINSSAFLKGIQNNNFSSTSNIPRLEDVCIKEFYFQTGWLLDTISKQIKNVLQISNIIKQVDQELTQKAENQTIIEDASSVVAGGAGIASGNGVASNNQINGNVSSNGSKDNITSEEIENYFPDYDELHSDGTKTVYDCEDFKLIIHNDGEKVTGFEYYYNFNNEENAINNLGNMNDKFQTNLMVDKILQKDKYIKVIFKEDLFKDYTLSQLKTKFAYLTEVK